MSSEGTMVAAVNAELEGMQERTKASPEAAMARLLAAEIDKGQWKHAGSLRWALVSVRKRDTEIRSAESSRRIGGAA